MSVEEQAVAAPSISKEEFSSEAIPVQVASLQLESEKVAEAAESTGVPEVVANGSLNEAGFS